MAAKPASLPGVSDLRLLNFVLALTLWLSCAGWLSLLYAVAPPVLPDPRVYPAAAAAGLLLLAVFLRIYLAKASLRVGWLIPLAHVAVNLGAMFLVLRQATALLLP